MKRELKEKEENTLIRPHTDTEPFPMKRELKEKKTPGILKRMLWYRTIPYEEGTERYSPEFTITASVKIQNHSLWRGNWKPDSNSVDVSGSGDTEPFPMKRELKGPINITQGQAVTRDTEPFPMKRELKEFLIFRKRPSGMKIQNHSLWRGNWKGRVGRDVFGHFSDTEPFPMKRELKAKLRPLDSAFDIQIQNHSLWRGNWKISLF